MHSQTSYQFLGMNSKQQLDEQFDIIVALAVAFRTTTHKTVDLVYNEKPVYYHELATKAIDAEPERFRNVFIYPVEMDFKARQMIGIQAHVKEHPEDFSLLDRIMNKGFSTIRRFIERADVTETIEDYFKKRYPNLMEADLSQYFAEICAALYYGSRLKKSVSISENGIQLLFSVIKPTNYYHEAVGFLDTNMPAIETFLKTFELIIPKRNQEYTIMSLLTSNHANADMTEQDFHYFQTHISAIGDFHDVVYVDSTTIHSKYQLTGEEILVCAQATLKSMQDARELNVRMDNFLLFVSYLHTMVLAKIYNETKTLTNVNSVDEWNRKLQAVEKEANKKVVKLEKERQNAYANQVRTQELYDNSLKENERLRKRLEQAEKKMAKMASYEQELFGLRDYMYQNQSEVEEKEPKKTVETFIASIQAKKVAVFGGHATFTSRLKEHLPAVRFISPDEKGKNYNFVKNLDVVYVFTEYFNHTTYYKLMNSLDETTKLVYLPKSVNLHRTLAFMAESLPE